MAKDENGTFDMTFQTFHIALFLDLVFSINPPKISSGNQVTIFIK